MCLVRINNRPFGDDRDEIRASSPCAIKRLRVPQTLITPQMCRSMVFLIDNGSADGFPVCRGRNFQNITSLAARDSDCFFRSCIISLLRIIWLIDETMRFLQPIKLRRALYLTKVPFLRWLPGTRFVCPHGTTPINLSDITGVLLHFKFVEDFLAGVRDRGSKEHRDGPVNIRVTWRRSRTTHS